MQALGLLLLSLASTATAALFAAALFGLSIGNLLMSQPLWLAQAYPGDVYPRVFALSSALAVVGVALGPYCMGLIIDAATYGSAFALAFSLSILACLFFLLSGTVKNSPGSN